MDLAATPPPSAPPSPRHPLDRRHRAERRAAMARMIAAGATFRSVARLHGVSESTVRHACRESNVPPPVGGQRINQAVALIEAGTDLAAACRATRTGHDRIRRAALAAGLHLHPPTVVSELRILALLLDGSLDTADVAAAAGITVRRALQVDAEARRLGIPGLPRRGEPASASPPLATPTEAP